MPKIAAERTYYARRAVRWLAEKINNHRVVSHLLLPGATTAAVTTLRYIDVQHANVLRDQFPAETLMGLPPSVHMAIYSAIELGAIVLVGLELLTAALGSRRLREINIPPNLSDIKKLSKALRQAEKSFKGDDQYKQIRSELISNLRNKDYASVLGALNNHQAILAKIDQELFDRAKSAAEIIHFVRVTWEKTKGMLTWPDVLFPSSAEGVVALIREQVKIIETARGLSNGNINLQEVETIAAKLYQRLIDLLATKKGRDVLPTLIKSVGYTTDEDIDRALDRNLPSREDLDQLISTKLNAQGFGKGYGAERGFLKMVRINRGLEEFAVDRLRGLLKDRSIETRTHVAFHAASLLDAMGRAKDALPEFIEILDDNRPAERGWVVAINLLRGIDNLSQLCEKSDQFRSKLITVLESNIAREHEVVRTETREERQWGVVGETPVTLQQKDERGDYIWGGDPIYDWVPHVITIGVPCTVCTYNEIAISMLRKLGINPVIAGEMTKLVFVGKGANPIETALSPLLPAPPDAIADILINDKEFLGSFMHAVSHAKKPIVIEVFPGDHKKEENPIIETVTGEPVYQPDSYWNFGGSAIPGMEAGRWEPGGWYTPTEEIVTGHEEVSYLTSFSVRANFLPEVKTYNCKIRNVGTIRISNVDVANFYNKLFSARS